MARAGLRCPAAVSRRANGGCPAIHFAPIRVCTQRETYVAVTGARVLTTPGAGLRYRDLLLVRLPAQEMRRAPPGRRQLAEYPAQAACHD